MVRGLLVITALVAMALEGHAQINGEMRVMVEHDRQPGMQSVHAASLIQLGAAWELTPLLTTGVVAYGGVPLGSEHEELLRDPKAMIAEAWIALKGDRGHLSVGRQKIEWPILNTNDVSLVPNLFEALEVQWSLMPEWHLVAGHARRMAGWENGADPFKFVELTSALESSLGGFFASPYAPTKAPVTTIGVRYEQESHSAQMWGSVVENIMSQGYGEVRTSVGESELGVQVVWQEMVGALKHYRDSGSGVGINRMIVGFEASWRGPIRGSVAYNYAHAKRHNQSEGSSDLCHGSGDILYTAGYYETPHSRHGAQGVKLSLGLGDSEYKQLGADVAYTQLREHGINYAETSLTVGKVFGKLRTEGRVVYLTNGEEVDTTQVRIAGYWEF
ncbi:MAG: hypothetical protein K6347_03825 [Campylobacterales bacterium]